MYKTILESDLEKQGGRILATLDPDESESGWLINPDTADPETRRIVEAFLKLRKNAGY